MNAVPFVSRRVGLLAACSLAATGWLPTRAAGVPLRFALAPFLSPAALLTAFRPLREHFERALDRPVEMVTAKDFRALAEAAQRGDYDVVQLPAHLARLAMVDWKFELVAAPIAPVVVVVVVKGGGPVRSSADLKGKTVGMLDALSLTATVGRRWLQEQGLAADVTVLALPSVNSGLFALDRGEVTAFVAADTQLKSLPQGTPRGETVLASIGDIPAPLYLARSGLAAADLAALRTAAAAFKPDPALPATPINSLLRSIEPARLARLDPLAAMARLALSQAR